MTDFPRSDGRTRCEWALGHELLTAYHDSEWGVPVHDDRKLFEMLSLEGAQAGLNWLIILKKREHYRLAFDGFDPEAVAAYDEARLEALLANAGIVRNRLKIAATIANARALLRVQAEFGSFDRYLWRFVEGQPIVNHWQSMADLPVQTTISNALSKDLQQRGFRFVGSTICYAFMQAVGMVNDHVVSCHRWSALSSMGSGVG